MRTQSFSAVGVGYFTNDTFAQRLERAIQRSERLIIEARVQYINEE
jgi:hypothetical protein